MLLSTDWRKSGACCGKVTLLAAAGWDTGSLLRVPVLEVPVEPKYYNWIYKYTVTT